MVSPDATPGAGERSVGCLQAGGRCAGSAAVLRPSRNMVQRTRRLRHSRMRREPVRARDVRQNKRISGLSVSMKQQTPAGAKAWPRTSAWRAAPTVPRHHSHRRDAGGSSRRLNPRWGPARATDRQKGRPEGDAERARREGVRRPFRALTAQGARIPVLRRGPSAARRSGEGGRRRNAGSCMPAEARGASLRRGAPWRRNPPGLLARFG